jgi:predicted XRE-type DNA-binding protein
MASERKQNESVPMNKLNEVANENYKKLSEEFVMSMQQHVQAISDLQQAYLAEVVAIIQSPISEIPVSGSVSESKSNQKEIRRE